MKKELSIETLPVEIKIIMLDKKRLTKAVLKQIPITSLTLTEMSEDFLFEPLGWVDNSDEYLILGNQNGVLVATKFASSYLSWANSINFHFFEDKPTVQYANRGIANEIFIKRTWSDAPISKKLSSFMSDLSNQIYIAI